MELISLKEAMAILKVSRMTLWRLIEKGDIEVVQKGVVKSDVLEIKQGRIKQVKTKTA